MKRSVPDSPCRVVVMISGGGSNLQALIDAAGDSAYRICKVISNNPEAAGLERARRHGIAVQTVNHRNFDVRGDFEHALQQTIDPVAPDLIVLAGFMRVLGPAFVNRHQGHMLNLHPSLLPKYPGLHTHRRALEAGDREHGASVHFVTEILDDGPLVARAAVAVLPDDDVASLKARVQKAEHRLLPLVVHWFASGRLHLQGRQVWLDQRKLPAGGLDLARMDSQPAPARDRQAELS